MHISFSDNAKSIKNLQDDLKKDLDESDCLFDDDLNTLLGNCAEPWNVSTYFIRGHQELLDATISHKLQIL